MIDLFRVLLALVLIAGTAFILIGALGLVRLSDFFRRVHAPTLGSTLGVGCVLIASVGYHLVLGQDPQPRELLITAFLFITAPISAHLMSKAALSLMTHARPVPPKDTRISPQVTRPQAPQDEDEDAAR
ncbi:multicomponent K+:H+ antiporter subunit G [Pseudoxanthomonas sp. SORGH_AS 997]|uniref:Multicomponent K+:H+ antiporter subunit G n=1 Tax=Pseudoxanthomonas winnipegensis TaxID=2480810 RepID=A0AAW8G755_9GAMM|nr:multicomponent K+:H+ antiporter subunit G [Pseudoxanthomonas winnipegensis]MDQ1134761.1 multicomponent K+:H+ antiporter subunit G [Pseudoxanthomonas winnipegensis]MDR6139006.1 multicomponent K+:H+ antiporter subunit G [Pseudoxanthomonas sp. SORGH_AS_0997]